jgi:hypothetical protein
MELVSPLEHAGAYAIGYLITFFLGFTVKPIIQYAIEPAPEGVPAKAKGGCTLGILERTVVYFALMVEVPEFVGVWLAFKVASKWQVWETVIKIGAESVKGEKPLKLETRRLWGSHVLQSFLHGTLLNILYAGLGIILAQVFAQNCGL